MKRPTTLALAALLALPTLGAQPASADAASDYEAAFHMLGPIMLSRPPADEFAAVNEMIATLEGHWYFLSLIAGDDPAMPSPQIIAKACELQKVEITAADVLSFDVVLSARDNSVTTRYSYSRGGVFVATTPISQSLERLFGDKAATLPAAQYGIALYMGIRNGPVTLMMPSPDLLVLMPMGGGAEMWGRCPE